MVNWAVVPIFQGTGTPAVQTMIDNGLVVGYNVAGRNAWLLASPEIPFCKAVYYRAGSYYEILAAVKDETYISSMRVYELIYYGSGSYSSVGNSRFGEVYGDYQFTRTGQVLPELRNPNIPAFETLAAAKEALNDGIWEIIPEETDPYSPDGTTEPGGGGGSADPSEDITDPDLPTISAVDTGFITLFKPSVSNLNSLATYMWSGGFDIDTFKKIMGNPMDAILGLSILPGIVPSGGSGTVVVGNVSTGVSMPKVGNQYVKFNCGAKTIKRKWNAFLDYSPYTRAYIYLPYIGIHPLEVDDIMNKSVTVKYNIDVLSGGCTAFVIAGGTTLYSFTGQCACSVPVTGRDWTTLINGVLGAVTGTVGAIGSAMVGNLPGAIAGAASVAQNVLSSKPTIERSGSMGGMAGMMGIRTPYIIIERPVQAVPGKQNKYIGYPSFVTKKLGDVSGYTQAEVTHLEAIPATLTEQEEIKNLLDEGVIL